MRTAVLCLLSIVAMVCFLHAQDSTAGGSKMGMSGMSAPMAMPGAAWEKAGSFMRMWMVMMLAMMLPTLAPVLSGYRRRLCASGHRVDGLTAAAGAGYFMAWAVPGALGYLAGLAVAAAAVRWPGLSRSIPLLAGIGLVLAGLLQLSVWKSRELGRCRSTLRDGPSFSPGAFGAWTYGARLGAHCVLCCLGYTLALFAMGVMSLPAMALVTVAITAERLSPRPKPAAAAAGLLLVAAGGIAIARVTGIAR